MTIGAPCLEEQTATLGDIRLERGVGERGVGEGAVRGSDCVADPFAQGGEGGDFVCAARQSDGHLGAIGAGDGEGVDGAGSDIQVSGIADQQAMIRIEGVAIDRGGEVAWAGDVSDVGFEILDLVENGRVIQQSLLSAVEGIKGGIQGNAFARAGGELPDYAIG